MNPLQLLSPIVSYFALVGFTFLVFWKWGARRFASLRIQNPATLDLAQILREVGKTLLTMVFSSAIPVLLAAVASPPLTTEGWSTWELAGLRCSCW